MQFTAISALLSAAFLIGTSTATDGVFAIQGNGTVSSPNTVYLEALNGNVGDAPKCSGFSQTAPLPASGTIPCLKGYALTYSWTKFDGAISATFTTPTSPAFTYNVPNLGCSAASPPVCTFGFVDTFPGKTKKSFVAWYRITME